MFEITASEVVKSGSAHGQLSASAVSFLASALSPGRLSCLHFLFVETVTLTSPEPSPRATAVLNAWRCTVAIPWEVKHENQVFKVVCLRPTWVTKDLVSKDHSQTAHSNPWRAHCVDENTFSEAFPSPWPNCYEAECCRNAFTEV